ncbi:hypothetical protein R3I93_002605 [Phoxinus phoxinus]|uniref:Cystatin domain-containing protein n=1 Tax=Phoxinus phoxinus TaxID=58324 RepID=A0AAN9DE48_9TELE
MTTAEQTPGGWSTEAPANGQAVCNSLAVFSDVEKAADTKFPVFIPIRFRTQIVKGTNYLVNVAVALDECVHVMVYVPCDEGKLTLTGIQYPKTMTDPLVPF